MDKEDIFNIDWQISERLADKKLKLPSLINKYRYITALLEENQSKFSECIVRSMVDTKENLRRKIFSIENDEKLNMYILETHSVLDQYSDLVRKSVKMNFMSSGLTRSNPEKTRLINLYMFLVGKYIKTPKDNVAESKPICSTCSSLKFFTSDNYLICKKCFTQVDNVNISMRVDSTRLNTNSRYTYERKTHFRDCINQYQGKENTNIPSEVIKGIIDQLYLYEIVSYDSSSGYDSDSNKDRFNRVTREHIFMFLKDIGFAKFREHTNLIYYIITGKRYDDISHLEYILLEDFDKISESYNKKFGSSRRKIFINNQNLLYQLLVMHKHPCKKEDFAILKTTDRKAEHDYIMESLCKINGWNMVSTF